MAASVVLFKSVVRSVQISLHRVSASTFGQKQVGPCLTWCRGLSLSNNCYQETELKDTPAEEETVPKRKVVDVETSVRYLNSKEFVAGYGDKPVWFHYRRNHKGRNPPRTRRNCLVKGEIDNASPCPICRDEYLVLGEQNVKLLEQFICQFSRDVFDSMKTGLCQAQQRKLRVAVMKAQDEGRVEMKLPFRTYNYDDYKI